MKISIVTCVYNGKNFGEKYVSGILNILDLIHEVIIIDDGSTDNPQSYMSELCRLEKINFITKPNSGLPDSRNFGVKHATGDFVILLDVDDTISRDGLIKVIRQPNNGADIIRCYCWYERENSSFDVFLFLKSYYKLIFDPVGPHLSRKIHYNNYVTTPGALIFKRDVLEKDKFNANLSIGEDWEYFARSFNKYKLLSVKLFLVSYLIVNNSMSDSLANDKGKLQALSNALAQNFAFQYPLGDVGQFRSHLSLHFKLVFLQRQAKSSTFPKLIKSYLLMFKKIRKYNIKIIASFFKSIARKLL